MKGKKDTRFACVKGDHWMIIERTNNDKCSLFCLSVLAAKVLLLILFLGALHCASLLLLISLVTEKL